MGVLSQEYIMQRLTEYMNSKAGKDRLADLRKKGMTTATGLGSGAMSNQQIKTVANAIADAFASAVIEVIMSFRSEKVHVVTAQPDAQGKVRVSIVVDEDGLRRESLHYMNKNGTLAHGGGVNDILALFTHGYTISSRRPYGFWVRDGVYAKATGNSMTRIGALMHRESNPFLSNFVTRMQAEYGDVCEVTLNNKYIHGGGG